MTQAVSHRRLITSARVQSQAGTCGICGGQSGTKTGYSLQGLQFSPVNMNSTNDFDNH